MTVVRSSEGDVLDALILAHYGRTADLGDVLAANPGLAAYGAILPAGVMITMPDIAAPEDAGTLRLWGQSP